MRVQMATAGTILALFMGWSAAEASAASTIGQSPPTVGAPGGCSSGAFVQLAVSSGPDYVVPADGVITSWTSSLEGTVAFSTFRPGAGAGEFTRTGADTRTVGGMTTSFPVRMAVLAGDRIGLQNPPGISNCYSETGNSADIFGVAGSAPIGTPTTFTPTSPYRLNLSAVVELDADGDGYGDDSQDGCPSDATTQGPCPDVTPPETTITKKPPNKTSKSTVKFKFSSSEAGSTFECKKDKKPWKPCTSPTKMRRLDEGRHKFKVRAIDAAGNVDPTPARDRFKVVG